MIKNEKEMRLEIKENMRGGNGSIEILHLLEKEELKGKSRLVAKMTIKPNDSVGLHKHENEEEIYYIIKGKGLLNDNGVNKNVEKGMVILTSDGEEHSIINNGTEDLEIMAVILLH